MELRTEEILLTNKNTDEILFFDNDCISAFLWIDDTSVVTELYGNRVAIPTQVYNEISACRGVAKVLKTRIDKMIERGEAVCIDMTTDSAEYSIYSELALAPPKGASIIGKGEAACIALAKERNGILASNNFSDTLTYIKKYNLKYTTTADILVEAYEKNIISEQKAEEMWQEMIARHRRLGANSFKQYLERKK